MAASKMNRLSAWISILFMLEYAAWGNALMFEVEPDDTIVAAGGTAVLSCAAVSDGAGTVQISWRKDGKVIGDHTGSGSSSLRVPDEYGRSILRNGSLQIVSFNRTGEARVDEGLYQCVAALPGVGTILSRAAKLRAASLARFDEEPEDLNIGLGQTARFSCSAQGIPPPEVTWFKNDRVLSSDARRVIILPSGSLEIRNVQSSDEGAYKCNISNVDRSYASRKGNLVISLSPDRDNSPKFTVTPKSQTVIASENVILECSATSSPSPRITWLKDGVTINLENGRFSLIGEGNLNISNVEEADRGTYQCRAQNGIDSVDVTAVLDVHIKPKVLSRQPVKFYAYEKEDIELPCKIFGKPTPTIQWYKDGQMILEGDYFQVGNGNNLKILGLVPTDGAMYQCIGINAAGNVQSTVRLQVLKADSKDDSESAHLQPKFSHLIDAGQVLPTPKSGPTETSIDTTSFSPDGPSAPLDLTAVVVSTRFVTLSWKPPLDPNGRIIAYAVVYQEVGSDRQRVFNTSRSRLEEVNVQGLQPNKRYSFRIVPYNDKGAGHSSTEIVITTQPELDVPGPSRSLRAWAESPLRIRVQWAPPETTNGAIQKYKLYYSEVLPGDAQGSSTSISADPQEFGSKSFDMEGDSEGEEDDDDYFLPQSKSGIQSITLTKTEAVLDDLRIFTEYAIWVTAFNEKGEGATSEQIQIRTLGAEPADTPHNVSLEAVGATSLALKWDPPPQEFRNGIITGYKIKYRQKGKKQSETVTTDGNVRFYAFDELVKGTEYQVRIAALNANGTGPFSNWLSATTLVQDLDETQVPEKPDSLLARANSDSITIAWTPPKNSHIMIRGYTIGWGKGIPDVYSKLVDGKKRTFTIDKLKPNSDYVISLRAYNQVGDGVPIYYNIATRESSDEDEEDPGQSMTQLSPPVGLKATTVSASSIVLDWTDSSLSRTQVVNDRRSYMIRYLPVVEQVGRGHKKSLVRNVTTSQQNIIIDNLKPGTQYEFSVRTVRGKQTSEWSLVAQNTTFEAAPATPPQDLTLMSLTGDSGTSSIILNWQPPRAAKDDILKGYMIFYTTDPSLKEWVEDPIPEDVLTHEIVNLTPETTYYFRMAARHAKGLGPYTDVKSISTPPSKKAKPIPPINPYDKFPKDMEDRPNPLILHILIGLCVVFLIASVSLCIYYRKKDEPSGSPKNSSLKKQRKQELNPPDLWIHHDHMELKSLEKSTNNLETPVSPSIRSIKEIGDIEEKTPLHQHSTNSLDKRNYMSSYIGEPSFSSQCHSLGRRRPKPIRMPVEPFFKATNGAVAGNGTLDHRSNPLFSRGGVHSQAQLRSGPLSSDSVGGQHMIDGQKTYDCLPSGSSTASSQQNLNSLVHYGSGSESGAHSVSGMGTLGRRSGANLKSFAVPVPPVVGTLPGHYSSQSQQGKVIITARPQGGNQVNHSANNYPNHLQQSPIKRISTSQYSHQLGGYGSHMPPSPQYCSDSDNNSLQKRFSTEDLTQEISNLEGLMKDLNAITANEFQC